MALKVQTLDGMKQIDTNLHKPVIFINGTKRVLDKAYTFINGQKYMIWGETGVQIDYISSNSLAGGNVFCIGDTWADVYMSANIMRLDISNLTNPSLIQKVNWGNVFFYNAFESQPTYCSSLYSNGTAVNKIVVDVEDGSLSVSSLGNMTGTVSLLGMFDDKFVGYKTLSRTFSNTTINYGSQIYVSGSLVATTGTQPSSASSNTNDLMVTNDSMVQLNSGSALFGLKGRKPNGTGTDSGMYEITTSGITKRYNASKAGVKFCYDNVVCQTFYDGYTRVGTGLPDTCLVLLDKSSFTELNRFSVEHTKENANKLIFLGRNGDYYYLVTMPYNVSATSGVKFIALNKSDLSVVFEKDLPADPFEENAGKITFWYNATCIAQVSKTGFLSVGSYNNSTQKLRIARFSAFL